MVKPGLYNNGVNFELPVIEDVLGRYIDSSLPECTYMGVEKLNECKLSSIDAWDYSYKFYQDLNGKNKWVGFAGRNFFTMEQVDDEGVSEVFGNIEHIYNAPDTNVFAFDIEIVNGEEVLAYCIGGDIKLFNRSTGVLVDQNFPIEGIKCDKGGLEIIYNSQTNKFSIITAIVFKGLHAIAELALPSSPIVSEISIPDGGSNTFSDRDIQIQVSGNDPKEFLKKYCVKYNDSSTPHKNDSCWKELVLQNSTNEITDYLVDVELGSIPGDYKIFVWLMDEDGEISGVSNDLEERKERIA